MEMINNFVETSNNTDLFFKEKNYWMNQLSGELVKSYFPYDYVSSQEDDYQNLHFQTETFTLDGKVYSRLMQLRNNSDPRLHMIFTAVTKILIHLYTGNRDIILGTTIDKQESSEQFINTILPLRSRIENQVSFKQFLLQVRDCVSGAVTHQNYSIEELFIQLNKNSFGKIDNLFNVTVLLENIQDKKYLRDIQPTTIFSFKRNDNTIQTTIEYNTSKYKKETILQIVKHFKYLLEALIFNIDMKISDIQPLNPEEFMKAVVNFNNTGKEEPNKKSVHQLFENHAINMPKAIALVSGERKVSYKELNQKATGLARTLRTMGIGQGLTVALILHPSIEAVIAILGILKAGGAYLPIAPDLPLERIQFILNDSHTQLVLTNKVLAIEKNIPHGRILLMDEDREDLYCEDDQNPLNVQYELSDLAYIIYTSGSTGKPKGVLIEHGALANYICWASQQYVKNEKTNFPLYSSLAFDLTVTSIFTPLITGNTIFIYRGEEKEFLLEKILGENHVDVIKLTPLHLMLTNHAAGNQSQIQRFIVGGEKLETQLAQKIYNNYSGRVEVINEYGPTEATVGCMIYKFNPQKDNTLSVPIGTPANNMQIYLLDQNDKNVPLGGIGELYIGGTGLARGYLNRPELTAERFIPHPYQSGEKLYKTGDKARRMLDGNIEFLGRMDRQVKIRGYRIELEEVERFLLKHNHITQAVVIDKEEVTGYKYLVAYIVPLATNKNTEIHINPEELRDYLSQSLPEFMIPSYFVTMDRLPLTANGKVDCKSLPEPKKNLDTDGKYHPPNTDMEKIMVDIWEDVMKIEQVGIADSYFSLGGDSIKAIQISARLHNLGWKLDLKDLFQYTTIQELVHHIKPVREKSFQGIVEGEVNLTPIQKWYFEKNFTDQHHFNLSVLIHRPEGIDEDIIKKTFNKLVEHHDALRIVFKNEKGKIKQQNKGYSDKQYDLQVFDIKNEKNYKDVIQEKCNQIQGSINLNDGPLVKVGLFKWTKGDYLLIAIHHLVMDTVSWRILFEDFNSLYKQIEDKVPEEVLNIPLKTTSYQEWSQKLIQYSNSETLLNELRYWKNIENTKSDIFIKNKDGMIGKIKDSQKLSFCLSEDYTEMLLKQVHLAYNTEINDILLAALGLAANEWTGTINIPIFMEGHGREEIIPDIDITRTVGWFSSWYPVVLNLKNNHDISAVIKNIKEMLRNIPFKGIGYGILRYLTNKENNNNIKLKLSPDIGFNYLGQLDGDLKNESFQVADISQGYSTSMEMERICPLYILGSVYEKKLEISISYNAIHYQEEEIRSFLDRYKKYLHQIIDHCLSREEVELTLSDYSAPIEENEAELVFDALSNLNLDN